MFPLTEIAEIDINIRTRIVHLSQFLPAKTSIQKHESKRR